MAKDKTKTVRVVGAGLAGSECANYLATHGFKVSLYDIKPKKYTPAHKSDKFGELVCSNSLKSNDVYGNACGLLKEELRRLGSLVIEAGDATRVPAGNALAVNREDFATYITGRLKSNVNVSVFCEEITEIDDDIPTVYATGPLTTDKLSERIREKTGDGLSFYDASAPIISADSIDMTKAFIGDRYDKGNGDHINCPMEKEEYLAFYDALINAERAELHDFETNVFEGCMPVEIMATRGIDTLRFGPLKPKGLRNPETGKTAYACLQLRKEDKFGNSYNMIGFQTNLKFGEQKRVFGMIPALKNAEFLRYGVMHRNTFINSPKSLNADLSLKNNPNIFFAGQITGVEGYVESVATGLLSGINIARRLNGKETLKLNDKTMIGALTNYIATPNPDFQPMNANYGILETGDQIRDKAEKKRRQSERALKEIERIKEIINE